MPPTGSMTAEEAIRQRDRQLDEVIKTVATRDREREIRRQRETAGGRSPRGGSPRAHDLDKGNRQRQYELLQEAEKLRRVE